MWLTKIGIRRPVLMAMAWVALGVLGLRFLAGLPLELLPNIEFPVVVVATIYPGAGPQEVETLITKPIEEATATVAGIRTISSSSQENLSLVQIQFVLGTGLDSATGAIREKLEAVRATLPRDARAPVVQRFSFSAFPIMSVSVTGSRTPQQLRDLADNTLKGRLEQISGVASVSVVGGEEREIQVNVDRDRLQAYGLSIAQVSAALVQENLNAPAGSITEGRRQVAVRALGEFRTLQDIRDARVPLLTGGSVRLADVATVADTVADRSQISRFNGNESVGLFVVRASDANTVAVADAVKRELARIEREYPDLAVAVVNDQSVFTRDAVNDVFLALVLGALLAVVIVFFFLHDAPSTFIISLALPTSLLSAFIVIAAFGFSLNFFTMLGLSLAIGILVDDSIVVLENINRHRAAGELPSEAALNGRAEIGLAAVAITLVDVVVFVPVAFSGGITGQLLKPFGLTVATVTLFSLFAAFTLTPMLAARWLRRRTADGEHRGSFTARLFAPADRFYQSLDRLYEGVLRWALGHRGAVILAGVLALVLVVPLMARLGFEFIPTPDQGLITATIEMPAGTNLATTDAVTHQVEARLRQTPEVQDILASVGTAGEFAASGPQFANLIVRLRPKSERRRSDQDVLRELQRDPAATAFPGAKVVYAGAGVAGPGSPVNIRIAGPDLRQLNRVAAQVAERIRAVPGARDVDVSSRIGRPEQQVLIDRVRASTLGLSTAQISGILRNAVEGSTDAKYRSGGQEYPIRVRMTDNDRRLTTDDVPDVLLATVAGRPIYLKDVASVVHGSGPTQIDRRDRQRLINVTANVEPGYFAGNVNSAALAAIRDIHPAGVSISAGGQAEFISESGSAIGIALLLAVLLVYILLSALFESTFTPFAIMLALPMAWVGGILALVLTGKSLSLVSAIGFVLLTGLVMKNSILLVDYTNTLRARGRNRNEAIQIAGPTRLRPVIMTTLAVILGSLPTAMQFGEGSELRAPLAIVVIGGLIWSTLLTLLVIPITYTLLDDFRGWVGRLFRRRAVEPAPGVAEGAGR